MYSQKNVHISNISMLYYDKIGFFFEEININITRASKECDIWYYWYFVDKGFMFQTYVCLGCWDAFMMSIKLNNIAILNI